ncbi:MAG TPA: class I SAM-dependent methyltransferase [Acidimicrobiia bacterium]|nr:class I SAM-dependent methyltransferase [Acidimicrobiia bacterium]
MAQTDPYRRIARVYDLFVEPMQSGVRQAGLRLVPPEPGWRVLDIGCGTGTGLTPYVDAGCTVAGVEVSAAMLDKAIARIGDRAELHLTDGSALPFEEATFDLVMTSMVVHELPLEARPGFVAEMGRVARPEGCIVITDFHFGPLRGWRGPLSRAASTVLERMSGHYSGYRSFRASGGVPTMVAATGMRIEAEKLVAGGNIGLYVVRPDSAAGDE